MYRRVKHDYLLWGAAILMFAGIVFGMITLPGGFFEKLAPALLLLFAATSAIFYSRYEIRVDDQGLTYLFGYVLFKPLVIPFSDMHLAQVYLRPNVPEPIVTRVDVARPGGRTGGDATRWSRLGVVPLAEGTISERVYIVEKTAPILEIQRNSAGLSYVFSVRDADAIAKAIALHGVPTA